MRHKSAEYSVITVSHKEKRQRGELMVPIGLEVLPYSKFKLLDEDLLEGVEVVLLIENEHCLCLP